LDKDDYMIGNNFIFIHIPKTGGTSIERALDSDVKLEHSDSHSGNFEGNTLIDGKHWRTQDYQTNFPNLFDSYFKFMFIRNPWDRLASRYEWQKLTMPKSHFNYQKITERTFKEFVQQRSLAISQKWCYLDLMEDASGNRVIDFVGRFENLQNDFDAVCDTIGVPRQQLLNSNHIQRKHYTEYYDEETREIVAKHHARDIEYFGYEF